MTANSKYRYDLPFRRDREGKFLGWLVGLMVFLALFALLTHMVLGSMTDRWQDGLSGRMTIEIAVSDLSNKQQKTTELDVLNTVRNHPGVIAANIVPQSKIAELVEPWLGDISQITELPLPVLVDVTLDTDLFKDRDKLQEKLSDIHQNIRIEDHKDWLQDVLNLVGAVNSVALGVVLIVLITAIVAVAGAVQARLAVHYNQVELLHLIGATDSYIAGQFQKDAFLTSFKGAIGGSILAGATLILIDLFSGTAFQQILSIFTIDIIDVGLIISVPILTALVAMTTARLTVLRTLAKLV